jgi:hypothetical protein
MNTTHHAEERLAWRVVLVRQESSDWCVASCSAALALPQVQIPARQRTAENVNLEFRRVWHRNIISSLALTDRPASNPAIEVRYHLAELLEPDTLPDGWSWLPVASLSERTTDERRDCAAVQHFVRVLQSRGSKIYDGPFAKPGWFQALATWIEEALRPAGIAWNGRLRQLNSSASFSLICFETNRQAVWFKAVGEPNLREFPITVRLADSFPEYLPRLIATKPEWNGWLAEEAAGQVLCDISEPDGWELAAEALAKIQVASISMTDELLTSGAHDMRLSELLSRIEPFFHVVHEHLETALAPMGRSELEALQIQIQNILERMRDLNFPDALGHLDFNPGNIVVAPRRCAFLDWAEASMGHPFFTFEHFRQHARRAFPEDTTLLTRMASAYAAPWSNFGSHSNLQEGLSLSVAAAIFAYAVRCLPSSVSGWIGEPQIQTYLASLIRRMKRECGAFYGSRVLV